MALRTIPLVEGQVYHLFNRSINKEPILDKVGDCRRALKTLEFYRFEKPPARLSYYLAWGIDKRQKILQNLEKEKKLVEIISFCLMPNHFHLLLKQLTLNGISRYLSLFQNSYARCFNIKHKRKGPIFQGQFKAVRVETDEQLIHLSRYIHLNPYSSYVIKERERLMDYPWSSFPEYLGKKAGFCNQELVMSLFDKNPRRYQEFVFNQADYQRNLEKIKHMIGDE